MAEILKNRRHFILTGLPGVGKTTLVKSIVQELHKKGIECPGFFTEEVRSASRRIGFDIVTTCGQRGQLARVRDDSSTTLPSSRQKAYQVGQYSVNLLSFEQTALPVIFEIQASSQISSQTKVFVIDEIGKMEMFSSSFVQGVQKMISNDKNIILATIPVPKGKPIPLVEKIRLSPFSKVFEVTRQNRDQLLNEILSDLNSCINHVSGS